MDGMALPVLRWGLENDLAHARGKPILRSWLELERPNDLIGVPPRRLGNILYPVTRQGYEIDQVAEIPCTCFEISPSFVSRTKPVSAHGRSRWRPTFAYFLFRRAKIPQPGVFSGGFRSIIYWEGVCALANDGGCVLFPARAFICLTHRCSS